MVLTDCAERQSFHNCGTQEDTMKPNSRKNRKLLTQYPFVDVILKRRMVPDAPWVSGSYEENMADATHFDNLTIRVEKADGELMFRRADNVGQGDYSCIFRTGSKHKGQVMRRGEYLFAVNATSQVVNRVNWPRNDAERKTMGEIYGWTVLWKTRTTDGFYTNPIWNEVKYLVWVTVEAWHKDTGNDDGPESRFGEFVDRSARVTIYREPDEGFEKLQDASNVYEHLRLDSRLMTRGMIDKDRDILMMTGMLGELCITFQDEVYFNGMKDILDRGDLRGASGQFGAVKVLCAEMCGYDRVTLEDNSSYVTFQLSPESKHMYVLGQNGTLPQIRNLVRTVVQMWREKPELRTTFKPDGQVSVI